MSSVYIPQLTFTRFIAAISIVIMHYGLSAIPFDTPVLHRLFSTAYLGVSYFFVLSGFVLMLAYGSPKHISYISFIRNRIARMYPLYFVATLLALISYKQLTPDLTLHVLLIQSWFPSYVTTINGPAWALSVEFFFSLVFPLVYNYLYLRGKYIHTFALCILVLWTVSWIGTEAFVRSASFKPWPDPTYTFIFYFPLLHLGEFLLGTIAGYYFIHHVQAIKKNVDIAVIALASIMIAYLFMPINLHYRNGLYTIFFMPLILLLSMNTGIITRIFSHKIAIFMGELSFAIYILQDPIWRLFHDTFLVQYMRSSNVHIAFYSTCLVVLIASILLHIYIEQPARRLIRGISLQSPPNSNKLYT